MENKISILYVDDEAANIFVFKKLFEKSFKIYTAQSAEDGIKIIEDNPDIRVLISDLNMPIMDGYELINQIKDMNESIISYILSGYEEDERARKAIDEKKIEGYLEKPFNVEKIKTSILSKV